MFSIEKNYIKEQDEVIKKLQDELVDKRDEVEQLRREIEQLRETTSKQSETMPITDKKSAEPKTTSDSEFLHLEDIDELQEEYEIEDEKSEEVDEIVKTSTEEDIENTETPFETIEEPDDEKLDPDTILGNGDAEDEDIRKLDDSEQIDVIDEKENILHIDDLDSIEDVVSDNKQVIEDASPEDKIHLDDLESLDDVVEEATEIEEVTSDEKIHVDDLEKLEGISEDKLEVKKDEDETLSADEIEGLELDDADLEEIETDESDVQEIEDFDELDGIDLEEDISEGVDIATEDEMEDVELDDLIAEEDEEEYDLEKPVEHLDADEEDVEELIDASTLEELNGVIDHTDEDETEEEGDIISEEDDMTDAEEVRPLVEEEHIHRPAGEHLPNSVFESYIPRDIFLQLKEANPEDVFKAKEKTAVLINIATKNLTALSEKLSPSDYVKFVNRYFNLVSKAVYQHGGMINALNGHTFILSFGLFDHDEKLEENANKSIETALRIQRRIEVINEYLESKDFATIKAELSIHCGKVIVGKIGDISSTNFMVLGENVEECISLNRCSEEYNKPLVFTEAVDDLVKEHYSTEEVGEVTIERLDKTSKVFTII